MEVFKYLVKVGPYWFGFVQLSVVTCCCSQCESSFCTGIRIFGICTFVTIFKSCQPPPPFEFNSSTHIFPLTLFVPIFFFTLLFCYPHPLSMPYHFLLCLILTMFRFLELGYWWPRIIIAILSCGLLFTKVEVDKGFFLKLQHYKRGATVKPD